MQETVSLKEEARKAKLRMKNGFWAECKESMDEHLEKARENGFNESKAGRYFKERVVATLNGEKEDEFYLRVKAMLISEGEVSDAIGRLTDKAYFDTLSYDEKQRYTLNLSEKYLRALERFKRECAFEILPRKAKP